MGRPVKRGRPARLDGRLRLTFAPLVVALNQVLHLHLVAGAVTEIAIGDIGETAQPGPFDQQPLKLVLTSARVARRDPGLLI